MPFDGSQAAAVALIETVTPTPEGKQLPAVFPALSTEFYQPLGQIVTTWPILEIFVKIMTNMLLVKNGTSLDYNSIYSTKKRFKAHQDEFKKCFDNKPSVLAFHKAVFILINKAKIIRDYVSHCAVVGQPTPKGFSVKFIDLNIKSPKDKRYFENDIRQAATDISYACGLLRALATGDETVLSFSSHDISELQLVFGQARWNAAIDRELKIQPQPSRP